MNATAKQNAEIERLEGQRKELTLKILKLKAKIFHKQGLQDLAAGTVTEEQLLALSIVRPSSMLERAGRPFMLELAVRVLEEHGKPMYVEDIAAEIAKNGRPTKRASLVSTLTRAAGRGLVRNLGNNVWELVT